MPARELLKRNRANAGPSISTVSLPGSDRAVMYRTTSRTIAMIQNR